MGEFSTDPTSFFQPPCLPNPGCVIRLLNSARWDAPPHTALPARPLHACRCRIVPVSKALFISRVHRAEPGSSIHPPVTSASRAPCKPLNISPWLWFHLDMTSIRWSPLAQGVLLLPTGETAGGELPHSLQGVWRYQQEQHHGYDEGTSACRLPCRHGPGGCMMLER